MRSTLLLFVSAACVFGSQWEIGGGAGYGIYRKVSMYAPAGKAAAGIRSRFTLTGILGEDLYDRLGGEFRYTYQDGDPFIEQGAVQANVQGQSHAFTYNALFYVSGRSSRVRPYILAGIGAKQYVVTGPENPSQPLAGIGFLTSTSEWKPVVAPGIGVKVRLTDSVTMRADVMDYISPFPKKIIAPAPGGTPRGLFQQITPMFGLSYSF